jgi:hypothetical protein
MMKFVRGRRSVRNKILNISLSLLAFAITTVFAPQSSAQNLNFKIPPVKIPLTIKDQTVIITASAQISQAPKTREQNLFNLELRADLADLQQNITALLSSALDKDAQCGDRIAIQSATLTPVPPTAIATVNLHYERWACAKIFGKQQVKRLVGGNATIPLSLTPSVVETGTGLRLIPELGPIQADGSLGELLRSGGIADTIRDKMQSAIEAAMQKAANLTATLPPVAQPYATIQSAAFQDAGDGRMALVLDGQLRITKEQVQQLTKQLKDRVSGK